MNIEGAWKRGYTGKNIVVTILDDGIERTHPDLMQNYVSVCCSHPFPTPSWKQDTSVGMVQEWESCWQMCWEIWQALCAVPSLLKVSSYSTGITR